jgi:2-methylisocitrate lyase-like PEP mutase family enzyme
MDQQDRARRLADLHVKGAPLALYNAWDAGSAQAIEEAGSQAIATSSWSVAQAQGYADGEEIPIEVVNQIIRRIAAAVTLPVTADIEGGYTDDDEQLAQNIARLMDLGVAGINFEDRVVKGSGLYSCDHQVVRIAAIREAAAHKGVDLFINARTDLFLGQGNDPASTIDEALDRADAYAFAGASGFFIPGLQEKPLIARICNDVSLPVNVLVMEGVPSNAELADIGVARVSYGPIPFLNAMSGLRKEVIDIDRFARHAGHERQR